MQRFNPRPPSPRGDALTVQPAEHKRLSHVDARTGCHLCPLAVAGLTYSIVINKYSIRYDPREPARLFR